MIIRIDGILDILLLNNHVIHVMKKIHYNGEQYRASIIAKDEY